MNWSSIKQKYTLIPLQAKASLWFLVCSFIQKSVSLITTPIFTRIMSKEEYGRFGVFNSWYGIISIFAAMSLTGGVHIQGLVKFDNEQDEFTGAFQGLTTTLVLCLGIIYLFFQKFWDGVFKLTRFQMVLMFIIIWTTSIFGFWANQQRVKYSYKKLCAIIVFSSILKIIFEILFVEYSNDKVTARILGWAVSDLFSFGWIFLSVLFKGKTFFSFKYWKYAMIFYVPLIPHYLSQTVLNSSDRIMIQRMVGEGAAGIYLLAYSISLIMMFFNSALLQTISPWIYQKIKEKKNKDISQIAYMSLIFIGSVNIVLMLFAPEIVLLFAPKSYHDAIWIIPPVAMSVFFVYEYDLFAKFAFFYEKTFFIMIASCMAAVVNIVLNYYFINIFGYYAAGYTTLICYMIYAVAHYIFMRIVCNKCCDGNYPYNTKIIFIISITFVAAGSIILTSYLFKSIRYLLIGLLLIFLILNKNKIGKILNKFMNLKKDVI